MQVDITSNFRKKGMGRVLELRAFIRINTVKHFGETFMMQNTSLPWLQMQSSATVKEG